MASKVAMVGNRLSQSLNSHARVLYEARAQAAGLARAMMIVCGRGLRRWAASMAFALSAGLAWGPAQAAPIPWRTPTFQYGVEGKDLKEVLQDFAAGEGIPIAVDAGVNGMVSGRYNTTPQQFLDGLAATFGFIWYFDGSSLSITLPSDIKSVVMHLDMDARTLRNTLEQMKIADARFPIRFDDASRIALVVGPSHYVDLVSAVVQHMANPSKDGQPEIKIFRLKHAWAADRKTSRDGKESLIPGMVSVLRGMFKSEKVNYAQGTPSGAGGTAEAMTPLPGMSGGAANGTGLPSLPPLPGANAAPGTGLFGGLGSSFAATGSNNTRRSAGASANAGAAGFNGVLGVPSSGAQPDVDTGLPVIQADATTNSILIRDMPWRFPEYERVIAALDGRPKLIEIEVHIIEIDETALQQLGIDWSSVSNLSSVGSPNSSLTGAAAITAAPGGSLVAMLGNEGRYFLSKISALEQINQARIDASPKVSTLDNVEAVMDNTSKFYVPVSGYASAELYSISSGVSLRVLPMIVTEKGRTDIRLDVRIDDGQVTSQTVGNLPIVSNSQITTQAFVRQGQSLLIAGYRVNSDSTGNNAIPVLSKIPLLGGLFRYQNTQRSRMERLFLVSPRVVDGGTL